MRNDGEQLFHKAATRLHAQWVVSLYDRKQLEVVTKRNDVLCQRVRGLEAELAEARAEAASAKAASGAAALPWRLACVKPSGEASAVAADKTIEALDDFVLDLRLALLRVHVMSRYGTVQGLRERSAYFNN
jgi:hypothetical protein